MQKVQSLEQLGHPPVWIKLHNLLDSCFRCSMGQTFKDIAVAEGSYGFIAQLNSCTHIANGMAHWGIVGWPCQPNNEGLGHKPGSSMVASGINPDRIDGGWGQQEHPPLDAFCGRGCSTVLRPRTLHLTQGTSKEVQTLWASLSG